MIIPHDDKIYRGGEDSADSTDTLLTVADGVGGWALKGINPGLFSGELTRSVVAFSQSDPYMNPHQLAFRGCRHAGSEFQGTATLVILKLANGMKI